MMAMRPATILATGLVLVFGFGVWVTLSNGAGEARPPGPTLVDDPERPLATAPPAIDRAPAGRGASPEPLPAVAAEPPRSEPREAAANVDLRVRSVATHADVAAFRWRFRSGPSPLHGDGVQGHADLRLPPGARGQLLVESPGFAPFATDLVVPDVGAPIAVVDAFLAASAQAAGITLLVHDTALQPITNVRVDAFQLPPGARQGAWHVGTALWSRRANDAAGRYSLPELAPGDYGIRVLATDADGKVLPLLPYLGTFVLTGSSGYLEDVTLEPGCLPEFELFDAAGVALDPATSGVVQLQLHLPGGEPVSRLWTLEVDGQTTVALDTAPGRGSVALAQPVPAGTYVLEVSIADQQRVQQFVTLRAGERQHERITLP
jgi:hypothetical protein